MDSLVATVIHDAKNSLAVLGVLLAQARGRVGSVPELQRAETLATQINTQLVQLLVLYRAGEGSLRLTVDDQNLTDFLEEVLVDLALTAEGTDTGQAALETDFLPAREIGVWAFDAYLVKFVLLDALRNARRHARQRIRFSMARATEGGMRCIRFDIEDDGPGYPADMLCVQDGGDSKDGGANNCPVTATGSGLGLSFARLIAAGHATPDGQHGALELANDGLGQGGARFTLFLP